MQSNFSKNQLSDADNASSDKIFKDSTRANISF